MIKLNEERIYSMRRVGNSLHPILLSTNYQQYLPELLSEYRMHPGKQCASLEDPSLVILAENYDPFAADLRHLPRQLRSLEQLLRQTKASLILRTSSPLVLLSTPLLKNQRIHTLFVVSDEVRLDESLRTIETLHAVGCNVSVLWERSKQVEGSPRSASLTLKKIRTRAVPFVLPAQRKISTRARQRYCEKWLWTAIIQERLDTVAA